MQSSSPIALLSSRRANPADTSAESPELAKMRQYRMVALVALVILNIFDLITTRAFLNAGASEGNPLSNALLGNGVMPFVKGAVLLALGWSVARAKPKLSTTCAMFFVVGVYCTAIVVNLMVLSQVS